MDAKSLGKARIELGKYTKQVSHGRKDKAVSKSQVMEKQRGKTDLLELGQGKGIAERRCQTNGCRSKEPESMTMSSWLKDR
ncbi:hypothetical protein KI387_010366, partial [Taxus chinensis]